MLANLLSPMPPKQGRALSSVVLLAALCLGTSAASARADTWAEKLFAEHAYDFGSVPHGMRMSHPFWVVNNTQAQVQIQSVRISMGAATAHAVKHKLEPGEKTAIVVSMDSRRFLGVRTIEVFVTFGKPSPAEVKLCVTANSRDELQLFPVSLNFNRIPFGDRAEASSCIYVYGRPDITISDPKCDSKHFEVALKEKKRENNIVVYELSARVCSDIPEGIHQADVWLTTDDEKMARVRVPIIVQVGPTDIEAKLTGPVEPLVDEPATYRLEVRNKGKIATAKEASLFVRTGPSQSVHEELEKAKPLKSLRADFPNMDFDVDLPRKMFYTSGDGWNCDFSHCEGYYLPLGELAAGDSKTLSFSVTPRRLKAAQVLVYQGEWQPATTNPSSLSPAAFMASIDLRARFDANAPAAAFLPKPPTTSAPKKLPRALAEVPEVFFQVPQTKKTNADINKQETAAVIDKIHYLNARKTDGFLAELIKQRSDLAGLPFVMGDDCRMKPDYRRQFSASLELIRALASVSPSPPLPLQGERESPGRDEEFNPLKAPPWKYRSLEDATHLDSRARVASLMQVLGPESTAERYRLAQYLAAEKDAAAGPALARLAIFSEDRPVRDEAIKALKDRKPSEYSDVLVNGLKYPWPEVARRSAEAIAQLGRTDLAPQLIDVLAQPDPRAPQRKEVQGKKVSLVREVVRINHLHNCLLCHAPARADESMPPEEKELFDKLAAQVPNPDESLTAYYRPSDPDILVRLDVAYLRQDFSLNLPVENADPWPRMQRYDYLVRTREVSEQEAGSIIEQLQAATTDGLSASQLAAHAALRRLTGRNDVAATAEAWSAATRD